MNSRNRIIRLEEENRQLKRQLELFRSRSCQLPVRMKGIRSHIKSFIRQDKLKMLTRKEQLETLGNNLHNGCLFRFEIEANKVRRPDISMIKHLKLTYASITWNEISNIPLDDAMQNSVLPFMKIHPEDMAQITPVIYGCLTGFTVFNVELRYLYSDTEMRWLQISTHPRIERDLVVCDGIILDVTDRKQAEIELAVYRNELELLVKERTEELETTNEELASTNEELASSNEELASANEELAVINEELSQKNIQLYDEIEARRIVMQQLEDSESKLRNFIQQSMEGILIMDHDGCILEWNHSLEQLTGLSKVDVTGMHESDVFWLYLTEESRRGWSHEELCLSRKMYMEGGPDQAPVMEEISMKRPDGTVFHVRVSMFPIKMAETCYFGRILRDVTQQRLNDIELKSYRTQLEQMVEAKTNELVRAKEKAEESDRLKSAFLANLSHEVRTPLNVITGFLYLLRSEIQLSGNMLEYFNVINNNSEQLLRLIDDILDVSKIETGQMNICPQSFCVNNLMDELLIFFEAFLKTCNKSHIALLMDKSGYLETCVIYVDPVRLRQVLYNLLSNAVKFTNKGYICFGYKQKSEMLEFSVEDSGIGIASDQMETIFERFRQADLGNNRHYGGTGLGLTISRSLVELMGGEMNVTSFLQKGSCFTFTIPYVMSTTSDIRVRIFPDRP